MVNPNNFPIFETIPVSQSPHRKELNSTLSANILAGSTEHKGVNEKNLIKVAVASRIMSPKMFTF